MSAAAAPARLLDWTITVLPMRPGEATWRYGAFGLLSQYMPSLATSLAVIVVGGFLLSQRRFMMILAIVGGTLTACYLVMVGVWSLDVLQARPQVPVEQRDTATVGQIRAGLKHGAALIVFSFLFLSAWRASRELPAPVINKDAATTRLVVGQPEA